jgi:membrane-bound lytic murein transglycosylase D
VRTAVAAVPPPVSVTLPVAKPAIPQAITPEVIPAEVVAADAVTAEASVADAITPASSPLEPAPDPLAIPVPTAAPAEQTPVVAAVPTLPAPPSPEADSLLRRVDGERIVVDGGETLGHYAEWLEVSASRLRALNGLRAGRSLRVGQRLRLDFSKVDAQTFLARRVEYHKGIEEDFFGSFRVTGTVEHRLRPGENLWILSHRVYAVPSWLIQRYNPELDLARLSPGTKLVIPVTEKLG